jgi:hypothetical protein
MKQFKDLKFNYHICGSIRAYIEFENGFGLSVVKGSAFYSDGIKTYECAVMKEGNVFYDTPLTPEDDVLGWLTRDEVDDLMKKIQEL